MKNEVATKQNALATQDYSAEGYEGLGDDFEVTLPTAKLMQSNSPELDEADGLKKGDIVNSLLLEKMPSKFIPIMFFDTKILLTPREEDKKEALRISLDLTADDIAGSTILCRALDGRNADRPENNAGFFGDCRKCGLYKFDNKLGNKPVCTQTLNVLGLFEGSEMPVIIRFANTSFKTGKKLVSFTKLRPGITDGKYELSSKQVEKGANKWFQFVVKPAGLSSEEEIAKAKAIYDMFKTKSILAEEELEHIEEDETY